VTRIKSLSLFSLFSGRAKEGNFFVDEPNIKFVVVEPKESDSYEILEIPNLLLTTVYDIRYPVILLDRLLALHLQL
jgi:hypothetical protein